MALTIVDSDILIDVARGEADAINCLLRLEKTSTLAISAVTQGRKLRGTASTVVVSIDGVDRGGIVSSQRFC